MRLIGALVSPYVRRVHASLGLLGLPFRHEPLSTFADLDAFAAINPLLKSPTLVTDEGTVMMESSLILDYLDRLAPPERRLTPAEPATFARCQRLVSMALAGCEKIVQLTYQSHLRPVGQRADAWQERVRGQILAAFAGLEAEAPADGWFLEPRPMQPDVTAAIAWRFARGPVADLVAETDHPKLAAHCLRAEALPAFQAAAAG
jgi:glutathione S-transferase